MSKHTPGPWKVVKDDFGFCIRPWNDGGDIRSIAEIRKYPPGGGLAEDNAQLIAAVTEMLEALEEIVTALDIDGFTQDHQITKARAAIAKATGETK